MSEILYVKNMVCKRCIKVIRDGLATILPSVKEIGLGYIVLNEAPNEEQQSAIEKFLVENEFELLHKSSKKLVESIKNTIIEMVYAKEIDFRQKLSTILENKLHKDYQYLSRLFSASEGITIEKYFIMQRIERSKELLCYEEHSVNEIAHILAYSSTAHFSRQFKQLTGFTASEFRKFGQKKRLSIDFPQKT